MKELPSEYYDQNDSDNSCFLCEQPRYKQLHKVEHYGFSFTFKRCACGLIKQTPMPNMRFFDWFFNSEVFFSSKQVGSDHIWGYHDYFADEPDRLATSRRRYRRLKRVFRRGQSLAVMKIGPATGTFLHVAQEAGHQVLGCDVSSQFIEFARETYDVHVDHGRFEKQPYADNQFDVTMLFNVIENVPNQVEFLEAIRRTLKPGGHFILNFVDMEKNLIAGIQRSKYFLWRPPVCYAYTQPVLQRVLDKFGFEVIEVQRDMRYMSTEKITSLLGWRWAARILRKLHLSRLSFPVYAYPSRLIVTRRIG